VALDQPPRVVDEVAALLSTDEQARAARFRGEDLQRRFRVAHGALRVLLGARTGLAPAALRFAGAEGTRPVLADTPPRSVSFSLSHSGELALVALTDAAAVGVDVEQLRTLDDTAHLGESVFTPAELRALRAEPAARQQEAWFEAWTRKEAVLKALGTGLGVEPRALELLPPDFVPVARAAALAGPLRDAAWTVASFRPAPGYVAALAVGARAAAWRLAYWPDR
jgi:4'-phosphopantetheinyl transferase